MWCRNPKSNIGEKWYVQKNKNVYVWELTDYNNKECIKHYYSFSLVGCDNGGEW